MIFLNLTGFKLISGQGFYAPGDCELESTDPIFNLDGSSLTMTQIMVSLNVTCFKLLSRHGLYAPGQCDLDL